MPDSPTPAVTAVSTLLSEIADIGRDPVRGGYSRPVYSEAETDLRDWFIEQAQRRRLQVDTTDRNGIIWAWWNPTDGPLHDAVVTGSHLDSVPGGGAYDGPLGVATALAAVDHLRQSQLRPTRPLAIAVFPEEEGSRFGIACLGSRLLTGDIDPTHVATLTDQHGVTYAQAASDHGMNPAHIGRDEQTMSRIRVFLELHVEQGRGLIDLQQPVAVGTSILAHGRWRLTITGQGNHAGTTLMTDRADPVVAAAAVIRSTRDIAARTPDCRATVGRLVPTPGGTNVIASRVDLWLDVRHPDDHVTAAVVEQIRQQAMQHSADEGCTAVLTQESLSNTVTFDHDLQQTISRALPEAPLLGTGAGHDAGVLAGHLPTGMLFVRNPTGVSHSPEEHVDTQDADYGAVALAQALTPLLT